MVTCLVIACVVLVGIVARLSWKLIDKNSLVSSLSDENKHLSESNKVHMGTNKELLENLKKLEFKLDKIKADEMAVKFSEITVVFKSPEGILQEESFDSDRMNQFECTTDLTKNGEFVAAFYNRDIVYIKRELKLIEKSES